MHLSKEIIVARKREYPPGTRVALVYVDDPFATLTSGEQGTVLWVDDIATIHVVWDCGSDLVITYYEDLCKKIY